MGLVRERVPDYSDYYFTQKIDKALVQSLQQVAPKIQEK
jgi:hypothetical protein